MTLHFPKAALDSIIKTVSTLPSDKIYQQLVKLLLIEKRDTTTIPSIGLLRPSVCALTEGLMFEFLVRM
jgi:hypothetical protein